MEITEVLKFLAGGAGVLLVTLLKPLVNQATAEGSDLMKMMKHNAAVENHLLNELNECMEERDRLAQELLSSSS